MRSLVPLILVAVLWVNCSNSVTPVAPKTSVATFTIEGTTEEQNLADYGNHIESRHVAVYDTKGSHYDNEEEHRVTWFKDGNDRLRYDMEGDWSGADIQLTDLSLFNFGEPPVVLCSSDELLRPNGGCDKTGEGSGNFIYALSFPLGLPELDAIDADADLKVETVERETIGGYESRCYTFSRFDANTRTCFTPDGVWAAYSYSDSSGVSLSRKLIEVSEIADDDFDLPYPEVSSE